MDEHNDVSAKATAAEIARCKAIMTSDAGKQFPELARTIAFNTQVSASIAAALFDAVLIDFNAVLPSSKPSIPNALSYTEQKRQAGALGLEGSESDAG